MDYTVLNLAYMFSVRIGSRWFIRITHSKTYLPGNHKAQKQCLVIHDHKGVNNNPR